MLRVILVLLPCLMALLGRTQGCTYPITDARAVNNDSLSMPPPPPVPPADTLQIAEEMPRFADGDEAMINYFRSAIHYPAACTEVEGTVYLGFVVDVDGSVKGLKVLRGIAACPEMDAEAMRVARTMPAWIAGRQNGKPVPVRMAIPVRFRRA